MADSSGSAVQAAQPESAARTLATVVAVSIACSLLVSTAVTVLRPIQARHVRGTGLWRPMLVAAGHLSPAAESPPPGVRLEAHVIDLASGADSPGIDPETFDAQRAARDPATSVDIPKDLDLAQLGRRARQARVVLVRRGDALDAVVLPVYGQGLYSTLHGHLALEPDLDTVRGLFFHDQGETPGLGGEIASDAWRAKWRGKRAFDPERRPVIRVVRDAAGGVHEVDGITGATLTGDAVAALVRYWLGEHGFGPYLRRLAREGT